MRYILLFVSFLVISINSYAQPKTMLSMYGGYILPLGYLQGEYSDSLSIYKEGEDEDSYFIRNGYGLGLDLKFSMNKAKTFKLNSSLIYNTLQNNKNYVGENNTSVQISNNIYILSIGSAAEYMITSKQRTINPYFGAGLNLNLISGREKNVYPDSTVERTMDPSVRIGSIVYAGIEYSIGYRVGINAGVKYNIYNLIGRSSGSNRNDIYFLNDEETIINGRKISSRIIHSFLIHAGLTIYLGI